MSSKPAPPRELVITRVLDAPRALVFRAWTDPKQLAQWWGPNGFTNPVCEVDPRPGGALLIHMHGFGVTYPLKGTFVEVVEPERLVFVSTTAEDEHGDPRLEILNTVTFAERDGKTELTMTARVVKAIDMDGALSGMEQGWTETLERLSAHVAGLR
jgi:uncharacterized protein YndB with AHSA1/START domain